MVRPCCGWGLVIGVAALDDLGWNKPNVGIKDAEVGVTEVMSLDTREVC